MNREIENQRVISESYHIFFFIFIIIMKIKEVFDAFFAELGAEKGVEEYRRTQSGELSLNPEM